jgi:hypothetical protein
MPKTRPRRAAPAPEIRDPQGTPRTLRRVPPPDRPPVRADRRRGRGLRLPRALYDLRAALRDWVDDAPIFLDAEDGAAR